MRELSQVSHYSGEVAFQIDCNQLGRNPNTNPGPLATVAIGHLWYNSGLISWVQSASHTQGLTNCQDAQAQAALGLISGSPHILTTSSEHPWTERLLA
jgi:hypothetical protein